MSARQNILNKLRNSLTGTTPVPDNFDEVLVTEPWSYTPEQRIPQLRKLMEAVHTEIHLSTEQDWPALLAQLVTDRQLPSLLIAPTTPHGQKVTAHWAQNPALPLLKAYDRPVEEWKSELFNDTPASLTTTLGAIAATGSNGFAASGQAQQTQGLRGIDLSSQAGAWEGLQRLDSAIDTVSRSRATLGAVQNRFESAIANISIQNENAVQSRGRMVDANFAKEISNQTRSMILQEMGFAMQAQANQSSRWTLALLR